MSWSLFEVVGVELEYAIVRADSLDVEPLAESLLECVAGAPAAEHSAGRIGWSNELAAHVLELKVEEPEPSLADLAGLFDAEVARAGATLARFGARLLPGACHPWMDPRRDSRLWSGEGAEVYRTFDRLFDCRTHGWLNLQSLHLNLPFDGDDEFDRLHSALRLLLPLLPGLAASSPILEGRPTGMLDARLAHYRSHCAAVSSFSGDVIPEPIRSRAGYEAEIYGPIRRDLERIDPDGILKPEWTNARGAIARFDRGAIEIRLIDSQECPRMDLAVAALVVGATRVLVERGQTAAQRSVPAEALARVLSAAIRHADHAPVDDPAYLSALGLSGRATLGEVWAQLRTASEASLPGMLAPFADELDLVARQGVLARRLLAATGAEPGRERLREVWGRLGDCLDDGRPFLP